MSSSFRTPLLAALLTFSASCGADPAAEPSKSDGATSSPATRADETAAAPVSDIEPDERSIAILRTGYEGATMMPVMPHIKTRSRLQSESITALLEVSGGAAVAPEWADGIDSWRKALAYGEIAAHYARAGDETNARARLKEAEELEAGVTDPDAQGWRRGSVRVAIAEAYAYLGDLDSAARLQGQVDEVEAGELTVIASKVIDAGQIDAQVEMLAPILEVGSMDQVNAALRSVAQFYGRVYDEPERRDRMEATIREGWSKLPLQPRIELLETLVEFDIENGNLEKARSTADDVEEMVTGHTFNREQEIEMRARVASLRARAEDREGGLRLADQALGLYDERRDSITNIYRGRALRPLAVAYFELGETMTANDLFERALVEAVENPNSRPRADDLVQTCIAIVRCGVEPSESLLRLIGETKGKLGEPW